MFNDFIESVRETADEYGISLLPEDEFVIERLRYLDKTISRVREMSLTPICEGYTPIKDVLIQSISEMSHGQRQILEVIKRLEEAEPGSLLRVYIYADGVRFYPSNERKPLHSYLVFIDEVASEIVPSLFEKRFGILIAEGKYNVIDSLVSLANDSSVLYLIDFVREEQEPGSIFFGIEPRIHICPKSEADYVVQIDLEDGYLVYRLYKKEA